jgi:hypothetical protein
MAFLLCSMAAGLAGEWEEVGEYSARACALADPHSWVRAEALYAQVVNWSVVDPRRSEPLFEEAVEIELSHGRSPDPVSYVLLYTARLRRAGGREEALTVLGDWLAELGDSIVPPHLPGVFALYGETRTALELKSRIPTPRAPIAGFFGEFSDALLASAQSQFDEAEQHLATMTAVVREFAIPRGEADCLIGFAKVAIDRGDYGRASRLLATVDSSVGPGKRPFRTAMDALVYDLCSGVLREALDPETAGTTQAEGAALSLKETLDDELMRSVATAAANPATDPPAR